MRPIDADALYDDFKKRLEYATKWAETEKRYKSRAKATRDFLVEVLLTIKNAPTIEITCRKRKIDRLKKSNIKCRNCKYWIKSSRTTAGMCKLPRSPKLFSEYYHRCKCFEWKEGDENE